MQQVSKRSLSMPRNDIVRLLHKRECGSKGCLKSPVHIPQQMLKRLSKEHDRIPENVINLGQSLASRDISACLAAVRHSASELADHTGALEQREGVTPNSPQRDCFLYLGGPHILVRILQVSLQCSCSVRLH